MLVPEGEVGALVREPSPKPAGFVPPTACVATPNALTSFVVCELHTWLKDRRPAPVWIGRGEGDRAAPGTAARGVDLRVYDRVRHDDREERADARCFRTRVARFLAFFADFQR